MAIKLNTKDHRIIYELDLDSRQSLSRIAKNTSLSEQVVSYRLKNIMKNKVINTFPSIMDFSKLGYSLHKCCYKLKNLTSNKRTRIIEYLTKHNNAVWVSSSDGRFELSAAFIGKTLIEISNYVNDFNDLFSENISEQKIVNILKGEHFPRDYLVKKENRKSRKPIVFGSIPEIAKIDETDLKIVSELAENARIPNIDIAKKCSISQDNVAFRIQKLKKNGIIQNNIVILNAASIGMIHHKVMVALRNTGDIKQKALQDYCRNHPNITFMNRTLGDWNMEIDFEVSDNNQFREYLMDINNKFSGLIKDYSIITIYDIHKYNFFPIKSF
ncbi:AsnC family transcriptional regulator [Thermoproteota archaeon]